MADVEDGWIPHRDLQGAHIDRVDGRNDEAFGAHGTAVLGVLVARHNGRDIDGLCPDASISPVSVVAADGQISVDKAIGRAIARLSAGDVLLVELELPMDRQNNGPVEFEPAVFEQIRRATQLGILVVECAGNSGVCLDPIRRPDGTLMSRAGPDSGALWVSGSTIARRSNGLNYGSRVDCFAWSHCVRTCRPHQGVVAFGGTSAAGAIVAGAAALVQSYARRALGHPLAPLDLRRLLSSPAWNTPSEPPDCGIGVMPDVPACLAQVDAMRDPR